jgi:hypothetical protein
LRAAETLISIGSTTGRTGGAAGGALVPGAVIPVIADAGEGGVGVVAVGVAVLAGSVDDVVAAVADAALAVPVGVGAAVLDAEGPGKDITGLADAS